MKTVLIITLLFVIVLPCFAELTKEDIKQIIREELEPIKSDMKALESRMAALENKMAMLEGKMATKDDLLSIWKGVTGKIDGIYGLLIGVLVAIMVSVILPPVLQKWLEQRKTKDEEIQSSEELSRHFLKEIDELKQKIRELEKRKIET